jgi:hypothetical protein
LRIVGIAMIDWRKIMGAIENKSGKSKKVGGHFNADKK